MQTRLYRWSPLGFRGFALKRIVVSKGNRVRYSGERVYMPYRNPTLMHASRTAFPSAFLVSGLASSMSLRSLRRIKRMSRAAARRSEACGVVHYGNVVERLRRLRIVRSLY